MSVYLWALIGWTVLAFPLAVVVGRMLHRIGEEYDAIDDVQDHHR